MEHLSDDENEEVQELTFDDLYPQEELEEEYDEETLQLIRNASYNEDDEFFLGKKDDKKEDKKNNQKNETKKTLTLDEFIKSNNEKNKKWVSKRAEVKKVKENKDLRVHKRRLNPRLPKYDYVKKDYDNKFDNNFPLLE